MKRCHPILLFITLAFGCSDGSSPAAAPEQAPAADEKTLVDTCTGCHASGELDLGVHSRDELRKRLDAIRSGDKKHPTDLSALSDAELDAVVAKLAKKP